MTSTRPGRARRLAPDDRRAALVAATLPLVLRHGSGISTRQIAEAAGVAEGTIFRVFPDKDALVHAVVTAALDPAGALDELAAIDPALPLRERLIAVVGTLQRGLAGVSILFDALGVRPPSPRTERRCPPGAQDVGDQNPGAMNAALDRAIVAVVGPDAARLRVPAAELARLVRLLTFAATHPRVCDGAPLSADDVVGVLLDGVLAPPTTTPGGCRC